MFHKLLAASALSLSLAAGLAYAQESPAPDPNVDNSAEEATDVNPTGAIGNYSSDEERVWYTDNAPLLTGFFTDETMAEMRSEEEIRTAYAEMAEKDRDELKAACDAVDQNRGSYGGVTQTLCAQIGEL